MSERETFFFRRAIYLLIFGAFLFLLVLLLLRRSSSEAPLSVKRVPSPAVSRRIDVPLSVDFDSETFYQTIIENNLFRPLGRTPPRPIEPYRLLGTKLARDANTPPQAIVQAVTTNITHIVTLGSNLDVDTQVVDIQSKQVTLSTQGQQCTLMLPIGF